MHRAKQTLLALALLVATPTTGHAQDVTETAQNAALQALNDKNYKKCIAIIDEAFDVMARDKKVRLDEEIGPLYSARGFARAQLSQWTAALEDYRQAAKLLPDDIDVLNAAAWYAATAPEAKTRDGKFAVACATRAMKLLDKQVGIDLASRVAPMEVASLYDTVAAAYAEVGDYKQAVANQKRAVEIAEWRFQGDTKLSKENATKLKDFRERLELYRSSKPFRLK